MAVVSTLSTEELASAVSLHDVPFADWMVVLPVLIPMIGAALLLALPRAGQTQRRATFLLLLLTLCPALALVADVWLAGPRTMVMGRWLAPFGIAFTADLAGAMLVVAGLIVSAATVLATPRDVLHRISGHGYFALLLMMQAGVNGAFLTGDVFNLYVWFEVLLISSFGLLVIGSRPVQLEGTLKYALLNLIGTTIFLIAVGLLYALAGTLNMADLIAVWPKIGQGAPKLTIAALFLFGFAMKAAAFPVNFWLPASYHVPEPPISSLFAGLLTKVGIFALVKVLVLIMPLEREHLAPLIATLAALTMVTGALGALAQDDIRRTGGFLVISGVGFMLGGIAMGGLQAIGGTLLYALQSVVLMVALMLVLHDVERRTGEGRLSQLGGLYERDPAYAMLVLAIFLAACGLPPFMSFWPKVLLVQSALAGGHWWLATSMLMASLITTLTVGRIFLLAFWRPAERDGPVPAQGQKRVSVVIAGLAALLLITGLAPKYLIAAASAAAYELTDPTMMRRSVFPEAAP